MAQNVIYSPWERTKGPWLCLMTTMLWFSLLRLFSFVSAFTTSLIKLIFWLKFSTDKRQAEDMVEGRGWERVARTTWSCSVSKVREIPRWEKNFVSPPIQFIGKAQLMVWWHFVPQIPRRACGLSTGTLSRSPSLERQWTLVFIN